MSNQNIVSDRTKVDIGLFQQHGYDLTDITLNMNLNKCFVLEQDDSALAQCLVADKKSYCDISHFAYSSTESANKLLAYLRDFYGSSSYKYLEIGCGNANLELYVLFQRAGFRVVSVIPNHYVGETKNIVVENAIPNLDMIRFRFNLQEKGLQTIGYDASGVK